MPLFGSLLVSLFGAIAGFFVQYFSKKVTIGLAFVATMGLITAALLIAMRTAVAAVAPVLGGGNFAIGIGIFMPPNASACITALVATWGACTLYSWKREALRFFAQA